MQDGEAKALHTRQNKSGVDVSDPNLGLSWTKVRNDEDETKFVLFSYEGNTKIIVLGSTSTFTECVSMMNEDSVFFGGVRALCDGQIKFFQFTFIGNLFVVGCII